MPTDIGHKYYCSYQRGRNLESKLLLFSSYSWIPLNDESGPVPRLASKQGTARWPRMGRNHKSY